MGVSHLKFSCVAYLEHGFGYVIPFSRKICYSHCFDL